ncbi:MAG: HAD family hydrolase, partial [Parcubacteria group bacterium Greene1014_15]
MHNKKLILFDLDGTLAESKSVMDKEMMELFGRLLEAKKVAVISGGRFEQFRAEFLDALETSHGNLASLYLFPTCATSFYRYENGNWMNVYQEQFSSKEKRKIVHAFAHTMKHSGIPQPVHLYGDVLEDRESQITYSAAGQKAPVEVKRSWDPDAAKRLAMKSILEKKIPEFEIRVGGMTSIDVTRKGIDKAYGIRKIEEFLGIAKEDMLFIGDALFPGGNDYPV